MSIYFTEKERQWLIDIYKKMFNLIIKLEMQIKVTMKYNFIAIRLAKSKNMAMASDGEDIQQQNLLHTATANESINRYNYLIQ